MDKALVGACGVFHVSAELSRRGWIAMPTIRNTAGIDLIASKGDRTVTFQIKTNSHGKTDFPMSKSNEDMVDDNLYYAFVTLKGELERPDFYVIPSNIVADYIKKTHEAFVRMPPKRESSLTDEERILKRSKSTLRKFPNYIGETLPGYSDFHIDDYLDKWEILKDLNLFQ
jgi:hypothetical protein